MERKYKFTPRAEKELYEAVDWYENQKEGLGEELVVEVFQKIEQISEKPEAYSIYVGRH